MCVAWCMLCDAYMLCCGASFARNLTNKTAKPDDDSGVLGQEATMAPAELEAVEPFRG